MHVVTLELSACDLGLGACDLEFMVFYVVMWNVNYYKATLAAISSCLAAAKLSQRPAKRDDLV